MKKLTDQTKKLPIPVDILPKELSWLNTVTSRYYYNALWATLIHLKPKYCLELGTFQYYSAKVFSRYFQECQPEGILITADISKWNRDKSPPQRVIPIMIYPHREDIDRFHNDINLHYKNYKKVLKGQSNACIINSIIINEEMNKYGIDFFDFIFVDAGHDETSVYADLHIAKTLTKPNGWILMDDITNKDHDLARIYPELANKNKFYSYENWPNSSTIDMALINAGEFQCL